MVQLGCHPAQGWMDASARAGPPARPARGWHLRTPGDGAPPPHAPERGQRAPPGAWDAGVGGPIPGQRWHGGLLRVSPRVRTAGGLPRRGPHRWLRKLCARRNAAARIPGRTAHGGGDRPRAVFPAGVLRGRPTRGRTSAMASDHHPLRGVEKPGSLHNFKPLPGAPDVDGVASAPG